MVSLPAQKTVALFIKAFKKFLSLRFCNFFSIFQFLVYRFFICFIKFISKYFIFLKWLWMLLSLILILVFTFLLAYRHVVGFPINLISCNLVEFNFRTFVQIPWYFLHRWWCHLVRKTFLFLPFQTVCIFIYQSFAIHTSHLPLSTMTTIGFLQIFFIGWASSFFFDENFHYDWVTVFFKCILCIY